MPVPNAVALAPCEDQGEADDSPRPTPSTSKISDNAAAPAAPAKIAAHETALLWSPVMPVATRFVACGARDAIKGSV